MLIQFCIGRFVEWQLKKKRIWAMASDAHTCPILPPSLHLHRNLCDNVIASDANVIGKVKAPQSFLHQWIQDTPILSQTISSILNFKPFFFHHSKTAQKINKFYNQI